MNISIYHSRLAALFATALILISIPAKAQEMASVKLDPDGPSQVIHPEIYGHFAEHLGHCIYGGIWVGEESEIPNTRGIRNDVLEALQALDIPVLRWPGGCFADEYHWRDGIGLRADRPAMINTHWGGVVENNHFGTHEFFDLVELLGTKSYISGNVGSGTVQEMMEWVEYMTSPADSPLANERRAKGRDEPWKLDYFGVGNESWGCGGNMRPEYYADLYRRYNTFVKNYGPKIYRIACGANEGDLNWTEVLMESVGWRMDGLSLHYYTLPTGDWSDKGPATGFGEDAYQTTLARTLRMEQLIEDHSAIMDNYDPDRKVGLMVDEWGVWTNVEPGTNRGFLYQQNSLRDAIVAGLNFHIFHRHTNRVRMTNIAQMVNVLQAMILTDGPRMLKTPTYWVFEMFKVHQGENHLPLKVHSGSMAHEIREIPVISASASRDPETGTLHVSLINTHPNEKATVTVDLELASAREINGRLLTAGSVDAHNTFEQPETVKPVSFSGFHQSGSSISVDLPAKSIVVLTLE